MNYGVIYENAVAQELHAHGYRLFFYFGTKKGELDFLAETKDGDVLPIEVKSGKSYKRHSAIRNALATADWHIDRALVLCEGNYELADKVVYAPLYACMFLENE